MNKIYKVIYNKVRNCYVVVSELAKSHGKEQSQRTSSRSRIGALTLAITLCLSSYALAAEPVDLGNGGKAAYDTQGNLIIGKETVAKGEKAQGQNNTTIGTNSDTLRNVAEGETTKNGQPMDNKDNTQLVSSEGKAADLTTSTESGGSTTVGYNNHAEGDNSTAIGNGAKITNKPITYYADADGNKTTDAEKAVWYKDKDSNPTQVPQVFRDADGNTTTTPQYVHTYTEKDPDTGEEVTKTEITSDASKADQKDGKPVYNYQKSDNTDHLYSVTLYQSADNSIAAGTEVTANGSNAVAVGYRSTADNSAVAVGDTAVAKENGVAIGKETKASVEGSIALGKGSEADRSGGVTGWDPKTGTTSVKTGTAWQSGEGALSIGNGGASRQITHVAAGSEDSDAVNLAQLKEAMTHYYSVKTTEATDAAGNNNYLNDGATGNNALAAGVSAVAKGNNATAVGTQTYASEEDASAYGYRAAAMGKDSVSIGSGTSAQQEGSVAIGGHAQGYYAVQVGTGSTAQSAYSVAVGGHAKGGHSVEVGYGSTAQGSYSTSVGGHAIGNYSIAIGSSKDNWGYINAASAAGDNSIAIGGHTNSANEIAIGAGSATSGGQAITVGGSATGHQSVSVGNSANATTNQATAIGWGSSATGSQSTAVGGHAGDTNSTAVGQGANANYAYATAVGNSSVASGDHSTALGYGTSVQGSYSTAIGGASAKGTNVTAIGKNSTVGGYWSDSISDSTVIGGAHISGSLTSGTAIGSNASVTGSYGVALGQNASVAYQSTGVGTETKASNTGTAVGYGAQSSGYQSAAVGAGSNATGQNAVALGGGGAWGNYSIALGSGAGTTAHAIAIGQNSGAWGENAIAIGEGTNAWRANSIVLGKNSKSGADKNIKGYDPHTGVASVDDTSTWQSTDEAVSIGRAEERDVDGNITATAITRQLNNLAAGTLDTDAVNVAQLKAATQKVNMHDYSVWSPDTETDTNYTNEGAVAKNSMAAGVSASTTKDAENAVAIGYKAKADGFGATVIGQYGTATGQYALAFGGQQTDTTAEPANNVASGDNAVSFGERTTASGNNATAFGQETKATEKRATAFGERTLASGESATAFGSDSTASGKYSVAFGEYSTAAAENSLAALGGTVDETAANAAAIGNGAQAKLADSVALGSGALANRSSGSIGYDVLTGKASSNTSAAWVSKANAIAIGNDAEGSLMTRQITGVAAGSLDTDAVNVAQLKAAGLSFTTNSKDVSNTTDNYKGYKVVSRKLGDTIAIKASDERDNHSYSTANLTTRIAENGDISILMDEKPTFTTVITDNVIYTGNKDQQDKDGKAAKADTSVHYGDKTLTGGKNITTSDNETKSTRLGYQDAQGLRHDIATMDDGQIYAGDIKTDGTPDSTGFARTMNQKTTINGGVTSKDALTDNNIGVVSNGTDTLTVKLAKDLKGLNSVTTGKTVQNDSGITITNDKTDETKHVVINGDKISFGGNQVNNMGSGSDGTDADKNPTYNTLTNGANIGDVKNIANTTVQPVIDTVNKGWELDVNGTKQKAVTPTNPKVNLIQGQNITITGDTADTDNVTISTADDVRFNTVRVGGVKTGDTYSGGIVIGVQSGKNADGTESANSNDDYYITGLKNTNWDSKKIQSGRAATEDQLAKVSEAINNAAAAAGKRTVVTVNDKSNPATAEPGANAYGEYDTQNGNLMIAAKKDSDGLMTYNINLNDKLALGKDGTDGQEGTLGLTGKDGLPGTDGKQGYSTTIIKTEKGQKGEDGKTGKENLGGTDITRIVYTDKAGQNAQTVATLDDGLKFVGNDGQEVTRKLNETLSIKGGLDKDAVAKASSKNLGVRKSGDGLEIVMTDTPDFTKVTVGGDNKITIGGQDNSDTKNPANGNYITGLDNTKWDKDHVTENRAATEGQLRDVAGSITNEANGGGFALSSDEKGTDKVVKQDLGRAIQIKGDTTYKADGTVEKAGNIKTSVDMDNKAIKVELNKDVDLTKDGSIKAGNTTINSDGVETNKVKVGDITITDQGINGGAKQITNIGSGIDGKQYKDAGDNNAASIGDVKQLAKNEAKASEAKSGKNITVKDDHTVNLNDDIILGNDSNKQVAINGSNGQVVIGSGDSAMTLGKQANTAGDSNPENGNYLNGLDNKKWDGKNIQSGRAATEDQLKTVSDKVNSGRKFQGDDGQNVTVGMGDTLKIQGGAKDVSSDNNIGIVKGADDTLNIRLAKDIKGLDSVTTGNTTINNSGLTVKGDDNHKDITIQQDNVNMGGNKITGVAPGAVTPDSTDAVNGSQLYAAGQAISNLGGAVNKLGTRVDRVGAGSAALAALHPLDFDPDDKWDFAAGYGNYRGANAAAVGAYYRPNEDTMFSIGGSFGGGENMFNAGVSIKLGQGNHISTSRVAMAKEMEAMRRHMAEQDALIAKLESMHGMAEGPEKSVLFPDVAENHWAYQYVTALAKKGLLEGYPDGEFKGDRMMTRYEFAAIVYRIVESGAGSMDPELSKLVKEFSPELQYIRIDTIHRDDNGQPTVQRVRVKDRK